MRSIGLYVFIVTYCLTVLLVLFLGRSMASIAWLLGGCACALYVARRRGAHFLNVVPLLVFAIGIAFGRLALVPSSLTGTFGELIDKKISIEGTVVTLPDLRETNQKLTIYMRSGNERTRILATVPLYPFVHAGDEVRISGTLKRPVPFETDGGRTFAYDQFLRTSGVYAVIPSASAQVIGQNKSIWLRFLRSLERLKGKLTEALEVALPEPESALAVGILVGGKQGLGDRLINDFTKSGMLQIIVLSGFNVMIVANTLMMTLARVPKKLSFTIALSSIASFVLMAGAASSAMRAGLMAAFAITARTFGRRYDVLRIVCICLFLIALWNPLTLAYDPGFQFSFIATIGLVIGTPLISPRLLFLKNAVGIEMVATTLAAEIALLPLLLYQTGNLSFVSIAANVLAMPVIPFAMGASAAAAALALPLQHLSSVLPLILGFPAYMPLRYVIRIATLSASLPFANRILPAFPFWLVLVSYAFLAAFVRVLSHRSTLSYATLPRPGTGSPPRPNSGSPGMHRHTSSSSQDDSRPYRRAPKDRVPI